MLVIVRPPGSAFVDAISMHPDRLLIEVAAARLQHEAFCAAIEGAGFRVLRLPEAPELPDATFVSDTLVALPPFVPGRPQVVVATRPALASRQPEVASVVAAALPHLPGAARVAHVEAPATLEGGDVIVYGDRVAIGMSARTNAAGAAVLANAVRAAGYRPFLCPVTDRLHLATAVTPVGPRTLIGTAAGYASLDAAEGDAAPADEIRRLVLSDEDLPAANVLWLEGHVFLAAGFPRASALLAGEGLTVHEIELDQFGLADGGPTCLVNVLP